MHITYGDAVGAAVRLYVREHPTGPIVAEVVANAAYLPQLDALLNQVRPVVESPAPVEPPLALVRDSA